jgi:cysteine synthase
VASFDDNTLTVGKTPLVRLHRMVQGAHATVFAKIEARNPSFSVKCRTGAAMVWDAEKKGILKPGKELIEPTSGNTGIALAFVAAARGYPLTLTMPDRMSSERRKILRAFGARLILTDGDKGMSGSVARANEIAMSDPDRFVLLQQFENPANPAIHERTTGPEIFDDTQGSVDVLVAGVGTGGTISGTGRFLKHTKKLPVELIAVEPENSPVISQTLAKKPLQPAAHRIQGIGAGFVPKNLDLSLIDRVEFASDDESIEMARRLAREEGILCGVSSGAAVSVALRLAFSPAYQGKNIVVILPDTGERYLSTSLFE